MRFLADIARLNLASILVGCGGSYHVFEMGGRIEGTDTWVKNQRRMLVYQHSKAQKTVQEAESALGAAELMDTTTHEQRGVRRMAIEAAE